jgi:hypothetical protein
MMGHEDEEIRANCKELLKSYAIEDKYLKQFISSFKKQQFEECEELIGLVEKPHELTLDREDLNRLLAYHAKKKGQSKLKDYLLSNSNLVAAVHECENFYKFDLYLEDILASAQSSEQYEITKVELLKDKKLAITLAKPKFNQKNVISIIKREQIIAKTAK